MENRLELLILVVLSPQALLLICALKWNATHPAVFKHPSLHSASVLASGYVMLSLGALIKPVTPGVKVGLHGGFSVAVAGVVAAPAVHGSRLYAWKRRKKLLSARRLALVAAIALSAQSPVTGSK